MVEGIIAIVELWSLRGEEQTLLLAHHEARSPYIEVFQRKIAATTS